MRKVQKTKMTIFKLRIIAKPKKVFFIENYVKLKPKSGFLNNQISGTKVE